MALLFNYSCKGFFFLIVFSFLTLKFVASTEFAVGGDSGWIVPKSRKDDNIYNQWASRNRFKVDDTLYFKYQKDSVMVVTEEAYEKCQATTPFFFSNNGDTIYKLDEAGLFYFISGVTGHCQRGQKMIIKVLVPENQYQSANSTTGHDHKKENGAASPTMASTSSTIVVLLAMSFLALLFI